MFVTFYKYQGTGNDFIILDNRSLSFNKNDSKNIANFCDRRFGIGADGLILLENHTELDFKMVYFNADGHQSSMCGNGGRCITAFAKYLGIIENRAVFEAIDGLHRSEINDDVVKLQMNDVGAIEAHTNHIFLNTGSPHHVEMVTNLFELDVKSLGAKIRYGSPYKDEGANVNFVQQHSEATFRVRTYERGVEDETLSCGTGVTAVALGMHRLRKTSSNEVVLLTQGGELKVSFKNDGDHYYDIWLIGPATQVYKGEIVW